MSFDYFSKRLSRDSSPSFDPPMAPRPANGLTGQFSPDNGRPPGTAQPTFPAQPATPPPTGPLGGIGPYASVSMFTIPPAYRYHPLGLLTRDFNPSLAGQPADPTNSSFRNGY